MNAHASGVDVTDETLGRTIAAAIENRGYAVLDGLLPIGMLDGLFVHLCKLPETAFARGGIGRERDHQLNRFVRSDETSWLDPQFPVSRGFLDWMEQLRLGINRELYLGLFDYEAHYARYAPGAFYRKHRDAFAGGSTNRVLSTVLYLNPNWQPDDAGEMLLYAEDAERVIETVQPLYGRLVVFLSERFPHEVLATRRMRYSIAGWFRVNGSIGGQLDPPR